MAVIGMATQSSIARKGGKSESSLSKYKFTYLLASLVLLFLLFPFVETADIGRHLFIVAVTLILFASIWVVSNTRKNMYIALAIIIPTILLNWAADITRDMMLYDASQLFMIASFIFTVWLLFNHVLRAQKVTHDYVLGAISVYILIAMAFSSLYLLADRIEPESFVITQGPHASRQLTYSDYMYYSFGTITTAGTGNVVEIGAFVRSLSMIESIIGIFYV
ncbi:MAG TPA: ion channel, partial [Candidatus Micrarchaeota archaeon]|nr:ion channel [Candidatus Micrarchaeota archaeon]